MARNPFESTGLGRLGTWRSGGESPSFPGSGDARRLIDAVDVPSDGGGCTLVRVRLGASDRRTLVRVRERLLGEEQIVGTSIGRDAGPDDQGTFDILVVPDCDPVTIGRAIADVDDVVGVAATAFESSRLGGHHGGDASSADGSVVSLGAVDEALDDLRATVQGSTDADIRHELHPMARAGDDEDDLDEAGTVGDDGTDSYDVVPWTAPSVGGLEALEETDGGSTAAGSTRDGHERGPDSLPGDASERRDHLVRTDGNRRTSTNGDRPSSANGSRRTSTNGTSRTNGRGHAAPVKRRPASGGEEVGDRLGRLDARLSELEAVFEDGPPGAAPGTRSGAGDGNPTPEELADRLASLEATVSELQQWQRRTRDALVGDQS